MTPGAIYDEILDTQEELEKLGRRIAHSQPKDEHGRPLRVRIARDGLSATRDQQKHLAALCGDLAKQLVYLPEFGEFVNRKVCTGEEKEVRTYTKDGFRHMMAAIALRAEVVRNPFGGEGGPEFVVMLESTTKLTKDQYRVAIDLALAFGGQREVDWSRKEGEV